MDAKETFKAILSATQKISAEIPVSTNTFSGRANTFVSAELQEPSEEPKAKPLKVLVSWAHRGEKWTSRQEKDWERLVMEFTTELRGMGVNADIDLFHTHEDSADWTRFGQNAVREADYVLVAITEAWAQRWSGTNTPTVGAGAAAEADTLKGLFASNQAELQRKLKIVLLGDQSPRSIPEDMARFSYFKIDVDNVDTYEDLLRTLTNQPYYQKPDLGEVPILAPAVREGFKKRSARTSGRGDMADYDAVRAEITALEKKDKNDQKVQMRLEVLRAVINAMSN